MKELLEHVDRLYLVPSQPVHFQSEDGEAYIPRDEPIAENDLRAHFRGEQTAALNIVGPESTCRVGRLDFDGGADQWPLVQAVLRKIEELGLPAPLVCNSGRKGYGLDFCLAEPVPAGQLQAFLKHLLNVACPGAGHIDVRPDTAVPTKAAQAVMKLPVCKHRGSGLWSAYLDPAGYSDSAPLTGFDDPPDLDEQISLLARTEVVTVAPFRQAHDRIRKEAQATGFREPKQSGPSVKPDWSKLPEYEHPPCIDAMLEHGSSHEYDYDKANLNLAKYAHSRGLDKKASRYLATKLAEASEDHPSIKTFDGKIKNFFSNHSDDFRCDYPRKMKGWREYFSCQDCPARTDEWPPPSVSESGLRQIEPPVALDLLRSAMEDGLPVHRLEHVWPDHSLESNGEITVTYSPAALMARAMTDGGLTSAAVYRELDCDIAERSIAQHRDALVEDVERFMAQLRDHPYSPESGMSAYQRALEFERRYRVHQVLSEANSGDSSPSAAAVVHQLQHNLEGCLIETGQHGPLAQQQARIVELFARDTNAVIPTPFEGLNGLLHGGWHGGRLYVIVAPPKGLKTTLAAQTLDHAAANGTPALYVGYEMAMHQMMIYAMARKLGMNSRRVEMQLLDREEVAVFTKGLTEYLQNEGQFLEIWEAGLETTLADAGAWVRRVRRQHPDKTPIVVIDYLQLARTGVEQLDRYGDTTTRVTNLAVACKDLARKTGAVVIALSSTTKEAERQANKEGEIDVNSARDSLAIAHAADGLLTMQTQVVYVKEGKGENTTQVAIDPWEFVGHQARMRGDETRAQACFRHIQQLEQQYPRFGPGAGGRVRLSLVRHRGMTGDVALYAHKAWHRLEEVEVHGFNRNCGDHSQDGTVEIADLGQALREALPQMEMLVGDESGQMIDYDPESVPPTTPRSTESMGAVSDRIESTNAPSGIDYTLIVDADEARRVIGELADSGQRVGLDVETTGLDPILDRVRLVQLAPEDGPVVVLDVDKIGGLGAVREPLRQIRGIAHNAVFDMGMLKAAGISVNLDCTMLGHHLVTGEHASLENAVGHWLGETVDKTLQKSDWSGEMSDTQLAYAAKDAEVTRRLFERIEAEVESRDSRRAYDLVIGAQPAVVQMCLTGMAFERDAHAVLMADVGEREAQLRTKLQKALGGRNPNSTKQLGEWVASKLKESGKKALAQWPTTPGGGLKLGAAELQAGLPLLSKDARAVVSDILLPYRDVAKQRSTYGKGLIEHLHPTTGRIHADFRLAGAITGRMSCSKPNLQNMPREAAFRRLFVAHEGRQLVIADYGQMELRSAAHIAPESILLKAYIHGVDVHTMTAAMLLDKDPSEVTKLERQLAKAINFGLLFGMSAKGLQKYAEQTYGVRMSIKKARQHREAWFKSYPGFASWHQRALRQAKQSNSVRTPAGREIVFGARELTPFRVFNYQVQGGAAEVLYAAMARLTAKLDESGVNASLVGAVHDELIVEADAGDVEEVQQILAEVMMEGMLDIFPDASVKGLVECSIGTSWAEK